MAKPEGDVAFPHRAPNGGGVLHQKGPVRLPKARLRSAESASSESGARPVVVVDLPRCRHGRRGDSMALLHPTEVRPACSEPPRRSLRPGVCVPIGEGTEGVVLADVVEDHSAPVRGVESGHVARFVERAVVRVE